MTRAIRYWMSLLAAVPSVCLAAGKYSWFDDTATGAAVQTRPSAFGAEVYSWGTSPSLEPALGPDQKVSIFGDYATRSSLGANNAATPRFSNFGVRWQHRLSSVDRVSVSARQGDGVLPSFPSTAAADSLDTRATFSWTRDLPLSWKPSITGGVFLGDESARDDSSRSFGRRYYGFTVGGEMRLLESHTPYVSFRMERSLYDLPDSGVGAVGMSATGGSSFAGLHAVDDSSRFAAGWRWQVQRGWSMQAEASYGFSWENNSDLLPQDRERSRVFFGTRFDFR